ncbi:MAG TPA: hypothetical protein VF516_00150 [Kofleriaceae bacterium]
MAAKKGKKKTVHTKTYSAMRRRGVGKGAATKMAARAARKC